MLSRKFVHLIVDQPVHWHVHPSRVLFGPARSPWRPEDIDALWNAVRPKGCVVSTLVHPNLMMGTCLPCTLRCAAIRNLFCCGFVYFMGWILTSDAPQVRQMRSYYRDFPTRGNWFVLLEGIIASGSTLSQQSRVSWIEGFDPIRILHSSGTFIMC